MRCGRCFKAPRRDDNLEFSQVAIDVHPGDGSPPFQSAITAQVCRECLGRPDPVHTPGRAPVGICGVCCRALRHGDDGRAMRLAAADVAGEDVAPGCYLSCSECVARYKGRIQGRLLAEGYPVPPLAHFGGDWLL